MLTLDQRILKLWMLKDIQLQPPPPFNQWFGGSFSCHNLNSMDYDFTDLHMMLAEEKFDQFYQLYDQLPPDHKDLATRWTDFFQCTLLYR